jgi:hypothetical protein
MHKSLLLSILVFLGFITSTRAQLPVTNSCPMDAPVTIKVGDIPPGAELATVVISNKGPQPVSAVLLRWKFTDSNGMVIPGVSTVDMAVSGTLLLAGQNVTTQANVTTGEGTTLQAVDVSCATVLFSGKSYWGDKGLPEVTRLLGIRTGIRNERARLLQIYQTQGSEKLIAELKRQVAK